jgi:hypothetical protein
MMQLKRSVANGGLSSMAIKLNATWHKANRMPPKATLDQRIAWHLAHARACACRTLPASIVKELKRRGIKRGDSRPS